MSIMWSQPAIFNVLDPWWDSGGGVYKPLKPNDTGAAADNTSALLAIINLAQATNDQSQPYYGATIVFPGHSKIATQGGTGQDSGGIYYFQGPGDGSPTIPIGSNWPIRFVGTGNTKLVNYDPGTPGFTTGDFFSILTNGQVPDPNNPGQYITLGDNAGGMTFEDLPLTFSSIVSATNVAAVHTIPNPYVSGKGGARNVRLVRCVLQDCPIGVWFEEGLQDGIYACTFIYTATYKPIDGTAVQLGNTLGQAAKEAIVADTLFDGSGKPGVCTAFKIWGTDQIRVHNCHVDAFLNGILIEPAGGGHNSVDLSFSDCTVNTGATSVGTGTLGNCCLIKPGTGAQAGQIVFTSCTCELGASDIPTIGGPGVLLDATNGTIDTVRLVSCSAVRWPGPGVELTGSGTSFPLNVEIIGGMYSGNNLKAGGATNAYGIYVHGATSLRIVGASCVGKYTWIQIGSSGNSPTQQVGIYIDNGSSDIIVDSCDLTGNGLHGVVIDASSIAVNGVFIRNSNVSGYTGGYTAAINILASLTYVYTVEITDCIGYNDQGVAVSGIAPNSGVSFSSSSLAYYGPIVFYTVGTTLAPITEIDVAGHNTHLTGGSFTLSPGSTCTGTITYGGTPPNKPFFNAIGY